MCSDNSVDRSWDELWCWGQADLRGLVGYTFELQTELRRLQDAAAQNSSNSSRPPSTDRERPKTQSLRRNSGRKPGGQPGHAGRTLQFSENPHHVQIHSLLECECGQDLSKQPALDFQRRQVFDLPSLSLECTEHRAEIKECPCCGRTGTAPFPADLKAPVQYGKNFRALLSYLYDAQEGASLRISEMCAEMFGYAISEATLQSARQEQHQALARIFHRPVCSCVQNGMQGLYFQGAAHFRCGARSRTGCRGRLRPNAPAGPWSARAAPSAPGAVRLGPAIPIARSRPHPAPGPPPTATENRHRAGVPGLWSGWLALSVDNAPAGSPSLRSSFFS